MKRNVLLSIGLIMSFWVVAQENIQEKTDYQSRKNEINIGYFDVFSLTSSQTFGIGYKHSLGSGAIRMSATFDYSKSDTKNTSNTTHLVKSTINPRLGYEFRQVYNRAIVFYGVDAVVTYSKSEYTMENNLYNAKEDVIGYGLSPFIGLKYFITERISISTETCLNLMYNTTQTSNLYNSGTTNKQENTAYSTKLGPLGIVSINFHF